MIALIAVEFRKVGGSLALLPALAAPALPGLLAALSLLANDRPASWASIYTQFVLPIWGLFLLPMVLAAFLTLVAQVEHRARGWDHLLALPIARWQVFAAKAIVAVAGLVAITLLVLAFTWAGAMLGGAIGDNRPRGPLPWRLLAETVPLLLASTLALLAIQLWAALRWGNFVVPLLIGIGGTLVALAVAMTGTGQADWFPWVLPFRVLTAPEPLPIAIAGGAGGFVILLAMIADLSNRDFR